MSIQYSIKRWFTRSLVLAISCTTLMMLGVAIYETQPQIFQNIPENFILNAIAKPSIAIVFSIPFLLWRLLGFDFVEYMGFSTRKKTLIALENIFVLIFEVSASIALVTLGIITARDLPSEILPSSMYFGIMLLFVISSSFLTAYIQIIESLFPDEKRKNKPSIISTWGKHERTNALSDRHSNGSDGGLADEHAIMDGSDSRRNRGITS